MSKYGPAWVWFATGQRQVTPSRTLQRGAVSHSQPPQSMPHWQGCLILPLETGVGVACGLSQDKERRIWRALGTS